LSSGLLGASSRRRGAWAPLDGSSLADWDRVTELEVVVLLASEVFTIVVIHAGAHGPGDEIVVGGNPGRS